MTPMTSTTGVRSTTPSAMRLHRAPDPVPADQPSPEPIDNPHPHHPPVHMPQNDDPVPDHNPQLH